MPFKIESHYPKQFSWWVKRSRPTLPSTKIKQSVTNGLSFFSKKEKQNRIPFFLCKTCKGQLPYKAKIQCKDHHSRDTFMMLLPGLQIVSDKMPRSKLAELGEGACNNMTVEPGRMRSKAWIAEEGTPSFFIF